MRGKRGEADNQQLMLIKTLNNDPCDEPLGLRRFETEL